MPQKMFAWSEFPHVPQNKNSINGQNFRLSQLYEIYKFYEWRI